LVREGGLSLGFRRGGEGTGRHYHWAIDSQHGIRGRTLQRGGRNGGRKTNPRGRNQPSQTTKVKGRYWVPLKNTQRAENLPLGITVNGRGIRKIFHSTQN